MIASVEYTVNTKQSVKNTTNQPNTLPGTTTIQPRTNTQILNHNSQFGLQY